MIATVSNKCKPCNDCAPITTAIDAGTYVDLFDELTFSPPQNNLADYPNTWIRFGNQFTGWSFYGLPENQTPYTPNSWPTFVDQAKNKAALREGQFGRYKKGYLQGTTYISVEATITWDENIGFIPACGIWIVANGAPGFSGSCGISLYPGLYTHTNIGSTLNSHAAPNQGDKLKVTLEKLTETPGSSQTIVYTSKCDLYQNDSLIRTGTFTHTGLYNGTESDLDSSACAFICAYAGNNQTNTANYFYIDNLTIVAT